MSRILPLRLFSANSIRMRFTSSRVVSSGVTPSTCDCFPWSVFNRRRVATFFGPSASLSSCHSLQTVVLKRADVDWNCDSGERFSESRESKNRNDTILWVFSLREDGCADVTARDAVLLEKTTVTRGRTEPHNTKCIREVLPLDFKHIRRVAQNDQFPRVVK